jgi:hypothetical protein
VPLHGRREVQLDEMREYLFDLPRHAHENELGLGSSEPLAVLSGAETVEHLFQERIGGEPFGRPLQKGNPHDVCDRVVELRDGLQHLARLLLDELISLRGGQELLSGGREFLRGSGDFNLLSQ